MHADAVMQGLVLTGAARMAARAAVDAGGLNCSDIFCAPRIQFSLWLIVLRILGILPHLPHSFKFNA